MHDYKNLIDNCNDFNYITYANDVKLKLKVPRD